MDAGRKIRVLIVDDSAIVRKMLAEALASEPDLEVVGTAPDPFVARDKILSLRPDVLTLDIEMPRMDGLTFLKKLMRFHPLPVIVISSLAQSSSQTALEALQCGAVEVLAKPGGPYSVGRVEDRIFRKRCGRRRSARVGRAKPQLSAPTPALRCVLSGASSSTVIAIGASTGGTEAIREVLTGLPENMPGILIVQHIPPVFSLAFANRLNDLCRMRVKEAADGDRLTAGLALIAPGNFHMTLGKTARRVPGVVQGRSARLLPAAFGGCAVRIGGQGGQRRCHRRDSHRHGFGRRAGAAQDEAGRGAHAGPGRSQLRGFWNAARGHPPGAVDRVVPLHRVAAELIAMCALVAR